MKWKLLWSGNAPHVLTLCLPDITAHDQISLDFPIHITTSNQILYVGTRLSTFIVMHAVPGFPIMRAYLVLQQHQIL